ncbi:hypothetical protein H6G45_13420 [Synechocystis sp. FACHB-383]|uniref:hypothetical protein n=1 Tax=Synechocystis sp. FACHB-383 TaxID=2692864 RepID=UPI001681ED1E|nr:hypothetical protein [Synechocystis sp. FACHB-383]MBD2654462.1 hypothetical protein [Synechocystis sp. FACHB-383]
MSLPKLKFVHKRAVCTIATYSYLPSVRALNHSLRSTNPTCPLYVLIVDSCGRENQLKSETFEVITLDELGYSNDIEPMKFYYESFEICCALRGFLHSYFYEKNIAASWIFLDSDIVVFDSLEIVFNKLEQCSVLLNPHITQPISAKNHIVPIELNILVSGLYNGGFLGIRHSDEAKKFIDWFRRRLIEFSFARKGEGVQSLICGDQLWLNYIPLFFDNVCLIKHPAVNVAYWNITQKNTYIVNGRYMVDKYPLVFFHFSGWNPDDSLTLSRHFRERVNSEFWHSISEEYKKLLSFYGYENLKSQKYLYSFFLNGESISPNARYLYYLELQNGNMEGLNPFEMYEYFQVEIKKNHRSSWKNKIFNILENIIRH